MTYIAWCENPNKTLEGIKTTAIAYQTEDVSKVKTLIKPWKGLKLNSGGKGIASR
ncbi:hypothetical protein U27_01428 [Candidatus Vecturithrix granuli]|uniref:Uncharacterized protein n=1 Tax=Vecturithrix granuli TaxID=1499967 RepID=A0A081CAC2_VECG1|nr:hypothetical protein U27_01428 [Candidatus Vecturithrix granuli]